MQNTLQKSTEIYKKDKEVFDTSWISTQRTEIKRKIEEAEIRLPRCGTVDEHKSILKEIEDFKHNLAELDIERRIQPKKEKHFLENELPKLPDIYNKEFKTYYDRYKKLDKELKDRLQEFAKEIEPITKEMNEIERLEESFHSLKNKVVGRRREFLELSISGIRTNEQSLKPRPNVFTEGDFTLSSEVNTLVKQIKKLK